MQIVMAPYGPSLHANQIFVDAASLFWYVDGGANTNLNDGTVNIGTGASPSIGGDAGSSGCLGDNSASWSGNWFELGIWGGNQTANNAVMNSNQQSYWGF